MSQLIIVKYVRKEGSYSTVDIVLDKDITNLGIVLPNDLAKRFAVVSGVKGNFRAEIDSSEQDWLTILKGLRLMRWHTITSHILLNPNNLEETRFYMEREVARSVAFSPRTNSTEQDGSHHGEESGHAHAHAPTTQLLQRPALRPFNSYHIDGAQQRVVLPTNDSSANPIAAASTGAGAGVGVGSSANSSSSSSNAVPTSNSNPTVSNTITSSTSSSSTLPSSTTSFEFTPRPHYSSGRLITAFFLKFLTMS